MGWVNDARRELAEGRNVVVRPVGGSMRGRIETRWSHRRCAAGSVGIDCELIERGA